MSQKATISIFSPIPYVAPYVPLEFQVNIPVAYEEA
jgi:hypothetical protein